MKTLVALTFLISSTALAGEATSAVGEAGSIGVGLAGVEDFAGVSAKAYASEHLAAEVMVCGMGLGCADVGGITGVLVQQRLASGVLNQFDLAAGAGVGIWTNLDDSHMSAGLVGILELEARLSKVPLAFGVGYQPELLRITEGEWNPGALSGQIRYFF